MDAYALLTAEDRAYAETTGVRCEDAPDQFTVDSAGRLVFTIRGLQFVKYACEVHELPFTPGSLETPKDLIRLAIEMSRVRMGKLQSATAKHLQSGAFPASERDFARAVLEGDIQDVVEAAARHDACEKAGPNVVPLGFPRKSR